MTRIPYIHPKSLEHKKKKIVRQFASPKLQTLTMAETW